MKAKFFVLAFFILNLAIFSTTVQAADYEIGVEEDTEIILEIKSFDEELADSIYGTDDIEDIIGDDAEVGARQKMVITDIDDGEDVTYVAYGVNLGTYKSFMVEYDEWDWTMDTADFDGDPDEDKETLPVPEDPKDLPDDWPMPFDIIPTPVVDYLDAIDWDKDIDVEDNVLTIKVDKDILKLAFKDMKEDVIYEFTYDEDTGIRVRTRFLTTDDEVIVEMSAAGIPGYELPILLGFVGFSTLGLIYITMKRR